MPQSYGVIILAAGQGKRMRSSLPKVLHEIGGKPMIFHILSHVKKVVPEAMISVVVGHHREQVEAAILDNPEFAKLKITFVHQAEQKGTGHAARCVMDSAWGDQAVKSKSSVLVLPGDLPLITPELVRQMLEPLAKGDALRLMTCTLSEPTGYGRVVRRGKKGAVLRIVEERDASVREKEIHEVAVSIYTFQSSFLRYGLQRLSNKNSQGEYYLTDLVAQASRTGKKIDVLHWGSHEDLRGVNDPWELAQASTILNERCVRGWALQGVKFNSPLTTWIDLSVEIEEDARIDQGVILCGTTRVSRGAHIGPRCILKNVTVGENAVIRAGTVAEDSTIGAEAAVGPYAHLRPGSQVGAHAKIGNFVELKKTKIGENTSVAHLSYLGDAEVGKNVNIGCGFVTCNFDGRVIEGERKHRTIIEDQVFLGSDCQTVAPVRIGRGAYVASGSTITENVEAESLAIARARQVNKPGYAKKLRDQK